MIGKWLAIWQEIRIGKLLVNDGKSLANEIFNI